MADQAKRPRGRRPVVAITILHTLITHENASLAELREDCDQAGHAENAASSCLGWMLTAGFVERVGHGVYVITEAGSCYLDKHTEVCDV